jgi:hypothetical protein
MIARSKLETMKMKSPALCVGPAAPPVNANVAMAVPVSTTFRGWCRMDLVLQLSAPSAV